MDAAERVALVRRVRQTLGDYYNPEAFCLTIVPNGSRAAVLEGFGVDLSRPTIDIAETWDVAAAVAAVDVGDHVVAIEINGWQGTRHEVLRRVAPRGRAASFFQNVGAGPDLTLWSDGAAVFSERVLGNPPEIPEHLELYFAGLDFDAEAVDGHPYDTVGYWTAAVAVMERFTGVRLDSASSASAPFHPFEPWLDDRLPPATPPESDPEDPEPDEPLSLWFRLGSGYVMGDETFSALVRAVRMADRSRQRQVVWWAAREALRAAGLDDDPRVVATLDSVVAPQGPDLAPQTEDLMRTTFATTYGTPTPDAYLALKSLECALGRDPAVAVMGAVIEAAYDARNRSIAQVYPPGTVFAAPPSVEEGWTRGQDFADRAVEKLLGGFTSRD